MKIINLDGRSIYTISKDDVKRMGLDYNPTYFARAIETWKEGSKKDSLSEEELNTLKQKYNSNTMTRKECIDLLGDLVESGVMSSERAQAIYICGVPIDISKTQHGFLRKEYVPGMDALRDAWKRMNIGGDSENEDLNRKMGYDYFKTGFQIARMDTTIDNPDSDPYFIGCREYLDILEALRD